MGSPNYQLNAHFVRQSVAVVCTGSVIGMIASAATRHLAGVIALGCLSTAAIITLIAVVAVGEASPAAERRGIDTEQAARVENLVAELANGGADEEELRRLVGESVRLGRGETG